MNSEFSAVIIAKDEAHIIGKCIAALTKVSNDIIVVLDDRTSDTTNEIATALGAHVHTLKWNGYSESKNFGITKCRYDWVFCLDADEILGDTLIQSISTMTLEGDAAYEMNIQTYFGDYPVKYCGWFPDWNIRLFHKENMRWNDHQVHESLVSTSNLGRKKLAGVIHHYSFIDEDDMKTKFDQYAKLRAIQWVKSGRHPKWYKQYFGPYFRFFRTYVLKLGFMDGSYGYKIARNEYVMKKKELAYWKAMLKNHK